MLLPRCIGWPHTPETSGISNMCQFTPCCFLWSVVKITSYDLSVIWFPLTKRQMDSLASSINLGGMCLSQTLKPFAQCYIRQVKWKWKVTSCILYTSINGILQRCGQRPTQVAQVTRHCLENSLDEPTWPLRMGMNGAGEERLVYNSEHISFEQWSKYWKHSCINSNKIANPAFHRSMPVKTFTALSNKMLQQIDKSEGPVHVQLLLQR